MTPSDETHSQDRPQRVPGRGSRAFRRLAVLALVLLALYVSAGRLLVPLAGGQKENLEALLSLRLGAEVSIGSLSADWRLFSPRLNLSGLRLRHPSASAAGPGVWHEVDSLRIQLDVPRSLWRREWVSAAIEIEAPELEVVENSDGRWTLAGFGGGNLDSDRAVDLLLNASLLKLNDAAIVLRPAAGPDVTLYHGQVELRNQGGHHRLQLQAATREAGDPLRLTVAMEGDPRGDFSAESWIGAELDELMSLAPMLGRHLRIDGMEGRAELWASADRGGLRELRGRVEDLSLRAGVPQSGMALALAEAEGRFSARQTGPGRWQLWLQALAFDWRGARWSPGELFLEIDDSGETPVLDLQAERIDLGLAGDLLAASGQLPETGLAVLRELDPRGALANLRLHAALDRPESFRLEANLEDVSVNAWKAAPASTGIEGYVRAGPREGFVELDSRDFSLHLPRLFRQAWHYDHVNSRLHWSVKDDGIRISSSVIEARNEDIHGRVQFALHSRRNAAGAWQSELDLMVGVMEMDARAKSLYLPTLPAIAKTMDWLDRAVQAGRLRDSGFIFRGSTGGTPRPGASTVQSFYHIEDLSLQYLPEWPRLEDVKAFVKVDGAEADIHAEGGEIAGISLHPANATLRADPAGAGVWLELQGSADTGAGPGLDFLRDSPVGRTLGESMDDWSADGRLAVDLDLRIPLFVDNARPLIEVAVQSEDGTLEIPEYGLVFEAVEGLVNYSSESGLMADNLSGRLFDFPMSARIESFDRPLEGSVLRERGTRIIGSGRARAQSLADWSPEGGFLRRLLESGEGEIDYRAELRLNREAGLDGTLSSLRLESDLRGLAIDLPEPFAKPRGESRPLSLDIGFREQGQLLTASYGGRFYGRLLLNGSQLDRGLLYFGPLNQDFSIRQSDSDQPGLLVAGELEYFDLEAWRALGEAFASDVAEGDSLVEDSLRLVDVNIGRLELFGESLRQVNTQVRQEEAGWEVSLRNELVSGRLVFPRDPALPYGVELDYLRFPEPESSEAALPAREKPDPLAGLDPAALPAIDFRTGELRIGAKNLGSLAFRLRPRAGGADIHDFRVEMEDASITDASGQGGATLAWNRDASGHSTAFAGRFLAGDLARVLPALGYDANVESRSASFVGELEWPGSPAVFSITGSTGDIIMQIRDGRFVDIDSGGSRLFGALSFDAIVRRLQLDFSDLFGRGFAYDSIEGGLNFAAGTVTTHEVVRITGPSSKISIDGGIDLVNQRIDADMLVNLPLSQNISVLAGLLGAWPLAVSTYVAGKIFAEQVDDFTSLVYRLEGPWESLQANFEVPENEAAAQQAEPPAE